MTTQWHSAATANIPQSIQAWLLYRPSMTERLRSLCKTGFRVEVLMHDWQTPRAGDAVVLNLSSSEPMLVREVVLRVDECPWMVARTIMPKSLVENFGDDLVGLGTRPLGELLFSTPNVERSDFECAQVVASDPEYQLASAYLASPEPTLWARRSVFHLPNYGDLALTEVFLPPCLNP